MRVEIFPSVANGTVSAPPSKSMAHRLLICAGLADGVSRIKGISDCDDVRATIDCLCALGAQIEYDGDSAVVRGIDPRVAVPEDVLSCRESGSTLRFMIPIALLTGAEVELCGAERLLERPLGVYEDIFRERGMCFCKGKRNVTVSGPLRGGDISLPGDVSSQFISGLLFALPLCEDDTRIKITTKIESLSYIGLTLSALSRFGVEAVFEDGQTIYIKGGQKYLPCDCEVEGDYSGAAFCDGFNLLDGEVDVTGLDDESLQGDKVYKEHYKALSTGYAEISLSDCPDLGPILFALAAGLHGGKFTDTSRLRIKESDRACAMAEELTKLGADMRVEENTVDIRPSILHRPTDILQGHNDHRIVMALAVLCSVYGGVIDGAEAVKKSYPGFFRDIISLGIKAKVYEA